MENFFLSRIRLKLGATKKEQQIIKFFLQVFVASSIRGQV